MRDLLIGVTVVRADGVVAHAGGKVVKNVAGYDLGKLLTGSYGTLGVITEVAFRLHPRAADAPLGQRPGGLAPADAARGRPAGACTPSSRPTAVELDRARRRCGRPSRCSLEGIAAGVERPRRDGRCDAARPDAAAAGTAAGLVGGRAVGAGDVVLKLTHEIAGLPTLLAARARCRAPPERRRCTCAAAPAVGTLCAGVHGERPRPTRGRRGRRTCGRVRRRTAGRWSSSTAPADVKATRGRVGAGAGRST